MPRNPAPRALPVLCSVVALWMALAAGSPQPVQAGSAQAPSLMLASRYSEGLRLADYRVSEKLDGVRGYWDGKRLVTRNGLPIPAPAWFTAGWPAVALDGELWMGRGRFQDTVSTVRQTNADDPRWRAVRFMAFDLPGHDGPFHERHAQLAALVAAAAQASLGVVDQAVVDGAAALQARLREVLAAGGEGLMLHRADGAYRSGRSADLLKLKPVEDADARVVGHIPGGGRLQGRLGALLVETPQGERLRIGTGFSDAQREAPPAIGAWISFRYRGTHERTGLPRFPSFLRERPDLAE